MSQYFTPAELRCHCNRPECDAPQMDMTFMMKVDGLRRFLGIPLHVDSAARCEFWNKQEGGKDDSQHLVGKAIDLVIPSDAVFFEFATYCTKNYLSFGRISQTAVHVDGRDGKPKYFYYPPKKAAKCNF